MIAMSCCPSGYDENAYGPQSSYRSVLGVDLGPAPNISITSPSTGPLGGLSVTINANASATDPKTLVKADFYYQYCPSGVCGPEVLIGTDNTPSALPVFSQAWTFPSCGAAPADRFRILVYATDSNGVVSSAARVDIILTGRGC